MKKDKDKLGDRMKKYENEYRHYLQPKVPVIIRLDGKAFHTFTRGFNKPFDTVLMTAMQETMKYLCENIQNCVFGYTQSDEITLVLLANRNEDTSQWFDGNLQKMTSVSASMATFQFNRIFAELVKRTCEERETKGITCYAHTEDMEDRYAEHIKLAAEKGAFFDARAFNVPEDDVINCVIWRQLDAMRNSKQMVGQAFYSARELERKSTDIIVKMLKADHGIDWGEYPADFRHGSACIKKQRIINKGLPTEAIRSTWVIDKNMPFLVGDREYFNRVMRYEYDVIE
jgi:tRNA(His) 5'-end guanylyltransferase